MALPKIYFLFQDPTNSPSVAALFSPVSEPNDGQPLPAVLHEKLKTLLSNLI